MINVGAVTCSTYDSGERRRYSSRCSQGGPPNSKSVRPWASDEPYQLSQFVIDRLVTAALEKATAVEDARAQADMYGELGTRLRRLNREDQAGEAFAIAEEGANAVEEGLSRAYALLDLAQRLKASGDGTGSGRLLDAAEKIAEGESEGAIRRELLDKIRAQR